MLELRRRYSNLYVPSEFFNSNIRWSESFPPYAPFSLQQPCAFHVFHKSVAPLTPIDAVYEPADADSSFSARVNDHFDERWMDNEEIVVNCRLC